MCKLCCTGSLWAEWSTGAFAVAWWCISFLGTPLFSAPYRSRTSHLSKCSRPLFTCIECSKSVSFSRPFYFEPSIVSTVASHQSILKQRGLSTLCLHPTYSSQPHPSTRSISVSAFVVVAHSSRSPISRCARAALHVAPRLRRGGPIASTLLSSLSYLTFQDLIQFDIFSSKWF